MRIAKSFWLEKRGIIEKYPIRMQLSLLLLFYGQRVQLCWRHYLRMVRGVKFTGNWIQAPGQPGNP